MGLFTSWSKVLPLFLFQVIWVVIVETTSSRAKSSSFDIKAPRCFNAVEFANGWFRWQWDRVLHCYYILLLRERHLWLTYVCHVRNRGIRWGAVPAQSGPNNNSNHFAGSNLWCCLYNEEEIWRTARRLGMSRPDSRIHDRHIDKVPLQGSIPMRTQTYIQSYPLNNLIRVQRSINNKLIL